MTTNRKKKPNIMTDLDTEGIREGLETAVTAARMEMLRVLVGELMIVLAKQDFRLDDLLQALVEYSERRADWSKVTEYLVLASNAVVEAKEQLIGKKK
jgi:hypothetical protein